jgi:hypothetical protein
MADRIWGVRCELSQSGRVKQYIANQAEHHRVRSYQEEYREFLRKHGEKWDERYVWD